VLSGEWKPSVFVSREIRLMQKLPAPVGG